MVEGKVILKDGRITTVNEKEYYAEVSKYTDGIGERASKEFWEINGTNAEFMRNDKL